MSRTVVRYGTRRGQVAELWKPSVSVGPAERSTRALPVVVLVHGGFWRARYTKVLMRRLAGAVIKQGWAAWNIEYRRLGTLGGGGGWPATFADAAAAVDALATQDGLDLDRVVTCGHSAGGHLALWLAARPRVAAGMPGAEVQVPVRGAVSLAGVVDLRLAYELDLGRGAVGALLDGAPNEVPDRYANASPRDLLPLGVPQVLVHGLDDTVVPPTLSESYVQAALAAGDPAALVPITGAGHSDMLSPTGAAWSAAREHLERIITA